VLEQIGKRLRSSAAADLEVKQEPEEFAGKQRFPDPALAKCIVPWPL